MVEDIEPTGPAGMDRRTLIKRAGIVGAGVAVWSAPSVTSLASRAYAAGSVSTACKSCQPYSFPVCNPNDGCFCFVKQSGGCVCGQDVFCNVAVACSSDADCPSGSTCIDSRNGCFQSVCVADCGNTVGALTGSGPRASGR